MTQADVVWEDGATRANVDPLTLSADDHHWYEAGEALRARAQGFCGSDDAQGPPFDMEYVYSTYVLEQAEREGARVFNRPRAIRDHNEKMAIAGFPALIRRRS